MKALFLYFIIFTLQHSSVSGQTRISLDRSNSFDTTLRPLVLVGSFKTDLKYLVLDPQKIDSVSVLKDSTAISKFGQAGKSGVIIIYPKPNARLLRIDQILDNYKLSNDDKKLRVCINRIIMQEPQLILIEYSEISNVEVTNSIKWINVKDANSGERFINIITRKKRLKTAFVTTCNTINPFSLFLSATVRSNVFPSRFCP